MNWNDRLMRFNFTPEDGPESVQSVEHLEESIGVPLPADFRSFLIQVGGGLTDDLVVPCSVPTPFGEHTVACFNSAKQISGFLDSVKAPRNMVCIGFGNRGKTTCLSIAGLDHGQVFALDTEMRFFWEEDTLSQMPGLDPSIVEFFRLRDADELPERPWGYENCYHIADSFSELIDKLRPVED